MQPILYCVFNQIKYISYFCKIIDVEKYVIFFNAGMARIKVFFVQVPTTVYTVNYCMYPSSNFKSFPKRLCEE